jgi:LysR family transcriptional regulator, nod-box dependent transcriptional activator
MLECEGGDRMRYRALDINLLVLLDILLDTGSVSRTAEILCLSQPGISSSLSKLREHFGDELIVQVGRRNIPTPLADRLRLPLKDILTRTDALIAMRSGFDPAQDARRFSLVSSDYVSSVLGHDVLREVASSGPKLLVEVEEFRIESFDRFERGEIDMVIIPDQIAFANHPALPIFQEQYVCAVWAGNSSIGDEITLDQYLGARHVVRNSRNGNRQTLLDEWFLGQSAMHRDIAIQVPTFTDILQVLINTQFVATVQSRLVKNLAQRLPIRILRPPVGFPVMTMVMQWHRHQDSDEGSRWFRSKVCDVAARLDALSIPYEPRSSLSRSITDVLK